MNVDGLRTCAAVLLSTTVACSSDVIRAGAGGNGDGGDTSSQGGDAQASPDPEATCDSYGLVMDTDPTCSKVWNHVWCESAVRFAVDHGCRDETLANLSCLASTCEDAEACRAEGDAFVDCRAKLTEG